MTTWTKESVEEVVNRVTEKAITDEQFRELCKTNIHAAIKEVSGQEVPVSFKINVVDNTGYHIAVNLPALQKADGELDESELESVAGGSKDGRFEVEPGRNLQDKRRYLQDKRNQYLQGLANNTDMNIQ